MNMKLYQFSSARKDISVKYIDHLIWLLNQFYCLYNDIMSMEMIVQFVTKSNNMI